MQNDEHKVVKMQLTRAALERLIGGDREMELILTDQAVQQVIANHIGRAKDKIEKECKEIVDDTVRNLWGVEGTGSPFSRTVMAPGPANLIRAALEPIIKNSVDAYLAANADEIKAFVDKEVIRQTANRVAHEVKTRMDAAIKEALR